MAWLFSTNNPGLDFNQLTTAELELIQNLANLSYQDGDIIYYDNGQFQRLPIGSNTEVLTVTASLPAWEPAGGSGGVTEELVIAYAVSL